jgi:hypothetical protein
LFRNFQRPQPESNLQARQDVPQRQPEQNLSQSNEKTTEVPSTNLANEKDVAQVEPKHEDKKPAEQKREQKPIRDIPQPHTPKSSPTTSRISIASFVLLPPLRGNNRIQTFSIPQETDFVAMQLQLEADDFKAYRISLVDQANKTLWRSGNLKTRSKGGNKMLNIRFPANKLKEQIYTLQLTGIGVNGSEIISDYPFRAVVK